MNTKRLKELYEQFDIANLSFGIIHDKLGDLYEKFCVQIIEDSRFLEMAQKNEASEDIEYNIFLDLFAVYGIKNFLNIRNIGGSDPVPHRLSHGLSKTDVIAHITYNDGNTKDLSISCKQSTVLKVAFAEFDVNTICSEIKIKEGRLKDLLIKHQVDKSAKNFTPREKIELKELLAPIARSFVRWVITGSPDTENNDIRFPTSIIKFDLKKPKNRYDVNVAGGDFELKTYRIYTIEEYIDTIMLDKNGTIKTGGFGTGLSWTYATGSGGYKIQFKG